MQFSGSEDIDAPIAEVFGHLSEFDSFERSAIRRGVEVQRLNDHTVAAVGLEWRAQFQLKGKSRDLHLVLSQYEPSSHMRFESTSQGIDATVTLDLLALSPRRTRMKVEMDLRANTLTARLLMQSMKLARRNLTRRFNVKLAEYAQDIELRHGRRA